MQAVARVASVIVNDPSRPPSPELQPSLKSQKRHPIAMILCLKRILLVFAAIPALAHAGNVASVSALVAAVHES